MFYNDRHLRRRKIISFHSPENLNSAFVASQVVANEKLPGYWSENELKDLLVGYIPWLQDLPARVSSEGIFVDIPNDSSSHKAAIKLVEKKLWPAISTETDLQGYKLYDFIRLYATLFLLSLYITRLEEQADNQTGLDYDLGSHIFSLPKKEFAEHFAELSGIEVKVAANIIDDLTFDAKNFHDSLLASPFVQARSGEMYLLPRLITTSTPENLLEGALNRGKKKKIYSSIVQDIEQYNLNLIAGSFETLGYKIFKEHKFSDESGRSVSPDLVILDRHTCLIIEYKHLTTPTNVRQRMAKARSLQDDEKYGFKQLDKYVKFLSENQVILKKATDCNHKFNVFGVLVLRSNMSLPLKSDQSIEIIDWPSLKVLLSSKPQYRVFSDRYFPPHVWIEQSK